MAERLTWRCLMIYDSYFTLVFGGGFEEDIGAMLGENVLEFFRPFDDQEIGGVGPNFLHIKGFDFFDRVQAVEVQMI